MKKQQKLRTRLRATKSRLAAFLLAATAATGAWAATLSYSGYISTDKDNPSTVFSGVTLSDIGSTYVLKGNMGGGWVSSNGAAEVYNASNDGTTLTVQFQKIDGSDSEVYAKCVVVNLTQDGDDIKAYASATGASSTLTLGQDFSSASGTPASGDSANGYGVYDLSLVAGRKVTYKNTGTTSGTYTITGGYAAQPTWKMTVPVKGQATSGALVKIPQIRIGSRTTTWNADYDSAYITVGSSAVKSEAITTYASPYVLAYNTATTCNALEYNFSDSAPLMVNVGTEYDVNFYTADGTQTDKNPGGAFLIKTADAVEYALNMPNVKSSGWRPVQELDALVVATASISADGTWSTLGWSNAAADWTAAGATPVLLTVTDDCTVNVDSAVSVESIIFDVTEGKTLTLTGSKITAANGIIIKGGTVAVANTSTLSGTLYGNGTLSFSGVYGTALSNIGVTATSADWRGTVSFSSVTAKSGWKLKSYGSANSTIRFDGITDGYFNDKETFDGTVDIGSGGLTLHYGNGGGTLTTITTLTGSGEFKITGGSTYNGGCGVCVKNIDGFTGKLTLAQGCNQILTIGTTGATGSAGKIVVASGATATAKGEWSAAGGLEVSGTLTVNSGATVPTITTSDTAAYSLSANATIGSVSGSALASTLYIMSGTLTVADTAITSLTIPATVGNTYYNLGTLNLSSCTSLTTLYLDLGSPMTPDMTKILLPSGCTVVAKVGSVRDLSGYSISGVTYLVEETKEEYGVGSVTVENVPTGASVSVLRPDGTIVAATVDGTTATLSETVKIDGVATGFDATFTNTLAMAYSEISAAYINTSATTRDYEDGDGFYIRQAPWLSGGGQYFYDHSAEIGIVVVGKMTPSYNKIFIHIGNSNSGGHGILIATGAAENEVVIAYNDASTVTPITTMTVPNAATARHVYVINKVDSGDQSIVTIYLDGIKWKTVSLSKFEFTAASGVQVGSDFGGQIWRYSTGTYLGGNVTDTSDTGVLNVMRVFGHALGTAQVNAFTEAYPYVSPNGSSVRTFAAASEDWVEDGATDWANTTAAGVTTEEASPTTGAALTVNTSVATTISANLDSTVSYDSITVNGVGATFEKAAGYAGVISVAGSSVIGAPVTINAGALVLGGPVTITEGGSVTFDYRDYEVASADVIQLTGEMEEAESGTITIVEPTDPHYTYTSGYSGTQYVITPAVAVAVLDHEGTITGYTTVDAAMAAAVSGDTVTLQTAYLTPSTQVATYAADKKGVNVIVRGYTIEPVVSDGTTTWTTPAAYVWTGAGSDTNWTTPANWGLASGHPNANTMAVLFDKASTVVFNSNADLTVASVTVNAAVTLTGNGTRYLRAPTFDGSGTLTLGADACLGSAGDTTMSVALVVAGSGDDKVKFKLYSGVQWKITSTITGTGDLYCDGTSSTYTTFNFAGNTQDFEGTVTCSAGGSNRSNSYISSGVAAGAKSAWEFHLSTDGGSAGRSMINPGDNGLAENYYFGALNGYVRLDTEAVNSAFRVVIGGRAEDSVISGLLYRNASYSADYRPIIRKVGASRLTLNTDPSKLEIVDGKVELASGVRTSLKFVDDSDAATVPVLTLPEGSSVDPAAKIIGSDAPIAFDSEGNSYTWNGQIPNSNTGGFIKKGAGTLTLTALPLYTGDTVVEAGTLVVPVGTTFNGAVTVAEGAKIQFEADPTWADGATPTICTFTTAPDNDTLSRIEITGFGGRQSATLNYDSGTGEYVATVTSPTLVWNGADGANWGDTGVWLVGGEATTYMTGDKVSFPDSLFTGETTELTVNVGADVDPSLVTIAPATGHTYKFTGTGKVTTADLVVAATGAGTLKLAADVFSGLEIETAGMVTVAAGEGAVTLATVTSSSDSTALTVSSGSLTLTEGLGCLIQNDSTLILDGTFNLNKTITGTSANAELIIRGTIDRTQNGQLQWLNGYPGKFKLENNATLKYYFRNSGSQYRNRNMFGNGAVEFAGGTIYQVHANSPQDAEPTNNVTLVDNTTTTISRQDGTAVLRFKGTFDGNGTLEGDASMVLALTDASEFGGAVSWTHSSSSTANNIQTATATSAGATYNVSGAPASATQLIGLNFSGTAEMGAFNVSSANAQIGVNNANVELEIGGKANSASTLNGQFITNPLTITKVGANSTLTLGSAFAMPSGSTIAVTEGKLVTAATTFDGVNFTFANGTESQFTVAEGYEGATSDWELLRTTGTITLTGSQSVTAFGSTATGYDWTLKTGTVTENEVTYNVLYATASQIATWTGNGGDYNWDTASNWDTGVVPTQTTPVVFPSGTRTVFVNSADAACATMQVDGEVTFAQTDWEVSDNATKELKVYGNVTGNGTVKLSRCGIRNMSGAGVSFGPYLSVLLTTDSNNAWYDSWIAGAAVTFDKDVWIAGRLVTWDARHVFNGDITLSGNANLAAWGVYGYTFNDITVCSESGTGYIYLGNLGDAPAEGQACTIDGTGFAVVGAVQVDCDTSDAVTISAPVTLANTESSLKVIPACGENASAVTSVTAAEYYEVNTASDASSTTYTCQWASSATPAIDTSVETPVTVTSSTVTFAVSESSLVSGLYYRVKAVDGNGNESATASTAKVQYDGTNASALNFTAPLPTDGVLYYTIEASDTAN